MIIIDEVLKRIRENIAPVEKSGYYATVYIDNWIYRNTGDDKSNSQDDVELILSGEIFTDEILDFDKEFFTLDGNYVKGKGIFFYGYSDVNVSFRDFIKIISAIVGNLDECPEWLQRNGSIRHSCDVVDAINIFETHKNGMECFVSKWNNYSKDKLYNIKFCRNAKLKANVYFAASPFESKRANIKVLSLLDKVVSDIAENKLSLVKKKLSDISIPLPIPRQIDTYNVGQGNFSTISCFDGKEIVCDLGFSKHEDHKKYPHAKTKQENLNSDVVFISHLDIDHFIGTIHIPINMFQKKWIISVHEVASASAKRLVAYLYHNNLSNTYFVDDCGKTTTIGNYLIGQGNGKKIGHCSKINTGSLILKISNDDKIALLPGDCVYTGIPTAFYGKYDFLLVPHHCCDLEGKIEINNFPANPIGSKMAVLSYGPTNSTGKTYANGTNNSYGHPNPSHENILRANNYTLYHTPHIPTNKTITFVF